jgi:plastocyanin
MRKVLMTLALVSLVAAGCSKSSGSATRTVLVDNKASGFVGSFLAYYPKALHVHAGDTVDFKEMWSGEPHTVTLGKLVEAGLTAVKASNPNGPPPAAFAKLPSMFPNGAGDLNQNAAQPCYLASGDPSAYKGATPCPKTTKPDFDGKQNYYSSGFLKEGSTYAIKLSKDIAPGTYHYYCNVHGPDMSGSFTVVAESKTTPTQKQVDDAAAAQFKKVSDKLTAAAAAARAGHTIVPGNVAGYGDPSVQNAGINEFFPATINTKVGQKVTWTLIGFHTITFGAPSTLATFTFAPDGSVHIDPKAVGPAGGPPAQAGTGNGKGISVKTTDAGTYDGSGLKSSGGADSFPPNLAAYSITFTKAGTYPYRCLIHPGMGGVVQVS